MTLNNVLHVSDASTTRPNSRDSVATITQALNETNISHLNNNHRNNTTHCHHSPSIQNHQHTSTSISTSPSLSASTSSASASNGSSKYQGRRYNGKLPISDIPELVELCDEFLRTKNITGLAMIARQAGLPPHLRCKIWPILLKYHPFVQNPYLEIEDNDDDDDDDDNDDEAEEETEGEEGAKQKGEEINHHKNEPNGTSNGNGSPASSSSDERNKKEDPTVKIPKKEIKFDLKKYLRSAERYTPKVLSPEAKDMFEIQSKIFDVLEHAIIKFLKKWGAIVDYNSGLSWIALGLAEWVPPLPNSQFVLCGRDDVAKNGTKLRNVNDHYFEKINNSSLASESSSTFDSPYSYSPKSATPLASPQNTPPSGFKTMSFAEIYERIVLVILHVPDPDTVEKAETSSRIAVSDELKKLSLLPYTGGPISDRISFFLFCMRKLLPELHSYLAEEDCLNGDWLLWWLKYDGSKVWSRYDRGRTWDLLLGYRLDCQKFESNMKELSELSPEQIRLLGQDLFWNPMDNVNDEIEDVATKSNDEAVREDGETALEDDASDQKGLEKHDRSLSVLTLMSKKSPSFSYEKTPTLTSLSSNSPLTPILNLSETNNDVNFLPLDNIEPIAELPFSKVHPHVEIIFISLAFLKSKEYTISELDQSEIKTLFSRLSSLRTDTGEMGSFVSPSDEKDLQGNVAEGNANTCCNHNSVSETMVTYTRKSNRDIENIMIEAGELWRRFLYINMIEESGLDKV